MSSETAPKILEVDSTKDTSGIGGHPRGLTTLFFTEIWERFSYYGARAILMLYMVAPIGAGGLGLTTSHASAIYGAYTASVYMTALPGGWIADRLLGARRAVLMGGVLIALGNFAMAAGSNRLFYAGMIVIALGTGLLKPNVSSMVGGLYSEADPRRDGGFSIFYMGINLGAFLSPIICGYLAQRINWHLGFAAAGIGMVIGLCQFTLNRRRLAHVGGKPERTGSKQTVSMQRRPLTIEEWNKLFAIAVLFVFSAVFWMAFEQAGSSFTLFADKKTANHLFGYEFPSSWYQSVNSIFIIMLAPAFSWLWLRLGSRQPSSPAKFSYGLLFVGLGIVLITLASFSTTKVSPFWLIGVYLLHTLGELSLSPVGLSTVTKLAPPRLVGSMMGIWFLSLSLGNYIAGWVAGFFNPNSEGALVRLYGSVACVAIGASVILAMLTPWIRRLMGKVQ